MPPKVGRGDKKKSLLAYKEKLLKDLKYYEQRIDETRLNVAKCTTLVDVDDASSDSDTGLPELLDSGPSIVQLKSQQSMLKTRIQATLELAGLELLQHETNILTEPPKIEGEPPIKEAGLWREVMAECCLDLVPFAITFYIFQAERKFAPLLFRGLKVIPAKSSHDAELANSVLPGLRTPSDAIEVIRSYAVAYRSRRSTLARLADKFAAALQMEPLAEGGYLLKCVDLLEVSWTLQNEYSAIAPFRHRLKFDIDYMEEEYIKIIAQAHRQLSDPSVDTEERTLLLAKIISTCLQARPLADSGTEGLTDTGEPVNDREVMAPPRSLPKKRKTKSNENTVSNQKATKRHAQQENNIETAKKSKTTVENTQNAEGTENDNNNYEKTNNDTAKRATSVAGEKYSQKTVAHTKNKTDKRAASVGNVVTTKKNSVATSKGDETHAVDKATSDTQIINKKLSVATSKNGEMHAVDTLTENTRKSGKTLDKADVPNKKANSKADKASENAKKNKQSTKTIEDIEQPTNPSNEKEDRNSVTSAKYKNPINVDRTKGSTSNSNTNAKAVKTTTKSVPIQEPAKSNAAAKVLTAKVVKPVKKVVSQPKVVTKTNAIEKDTNNAVTDKNIAPNSAKETVKSVASVKNIKQTVPNTNVKKTIPNTANTNQTKKPLNEKNVKVTNSISKQSRLLPKPKISAVATKAKIPGNTEKENAVVNKAKTSKIPQKEVSTPKLKKAPLRVSPRKPLAKTKTPQVGANMKKLIQKPTTGIPRLMTKPKPRVT